ncbi:MAG: tetratricopeptide repeat protein, partial [Alphaproteobacteria bacterium]
PETLLPLVEPFAAAGEPWRALAQEQAAMLEWKLGRLDAARTRLESISKDVSAPVGLRARADAALTALPKG